MITMGLRATPKRIAFAIYDAKSKTILNVENIYIPVAFAWPEALKYVRNSILDVVREYRVGKAGVRTSESIAKKYSVERGRFPDRRIFEAHIPERLRAVVRKCLAVDPNDRYSSALEVANNLAPINGPVLDWRHSMIQGCKRWKKSVKGSCLEFEWSDDGSTRCFKTAVAGRRRRVTEGCKNRMTDREVRTFLGDH